MIRYKGISTLEILLEAKNYNQWISEAILDHLKPPALEIGAGTGNVSEKCLKIKPLYITDKDSGLVNYLNIRFAKEENVFVKKLDITKKPRKGFSDFFSTIYAVNVLEHIKDESKALKNMHSLLRKNGKLVLLIPAKKFAYTKLDQELGHFRRYEKSELIQKLTNSGYHIDKIYYINLLGLLSWYIRDKIKRKNLNLKPYHITIFDNIVPVLKWIESKIKIPVGISLIVVARKQ